MSANECCDMDGCLRIVQIDRSPEVRLIETFAGSKRDTMYLRGGMAYGQLSACHERDGNGEVHDEETTDLAQELRAISHLSAR